MIKTFKFDIEVENHGCPIYNGEYMECSMTEYDCSADLCDRPDNCPLIEIDDSQEGE